MLTILENAGWLLLPILGHAFFWIGLVNRIHGLRLRHRVVLPLQLFHFLWVPLASVAWIWAFGLRGPRLLAGGLPSDIPGTWRLAGVVFSLLAVTGLIRWFLMRRRPPAPQIISVRSTIHPIEEELAPVPLRGRGRNWRWLSLPGNESLTLEIIELELALPRLPQEWDGLRILHLSDLHFTGSVLRPYFDRLVELACERPVDMIAFTGDLLDDERLIDWIPPTLGRLSAPLGCHFLLGNHDWEWGDLAGSRALLEHYGWNDAGRQPRRIEYRGSTVMLTGDERPWLGHGPDWSQAQAGDFRLLLSHTPDNIASARQSQVDLMLAGHTHGGQACLPAVGPIYSPSLFGVKYAGGTFDLPPVLLQVSRGVGGLHPWRWNCRPEITFLTLRPGLTKSASPAKSDPEMTPQ